MSHVDTDSLVFFFSFCLSIGPGVHMKGYLSAMLSDLEKKRISIATFV